MQLHPYVEFAGYNMTHPLAKKVMFHYLIKNKSNIIKVMNDVVEYYNDLFNKIEKEIEKKL